MGKKISRILANGKEEFTPKRKKFAREYVKNNGNGTQAVLKVYDTDNPNSANQIAMENLRKPTVQMAIERALVKAGMTDNSVALIHQRNMEQEDNLHVSQAAVKDYYNIKGYNNKNIDTGNVNVAFIINTDTKKG